MRTLMEGVAVFLLSSSILSSLLSTSAAVDTIEADQAIRDGATIVSAGENFELGFFSPNNSNNRYLGIWYKKISNGTVVWVANREIPLTDNSSSGSMLKFNSVGNLVLVNGANRMIWSSNSSNSSGSSVNLVAQLLDTGNLVIKDANSRDPKIFIWESFDYPGDTLLPGMKIGKDLITGMERYLTAWKSADDPSPSNHTLRVDVNGYPQVFERKGLVLVSRLFQGLPRTILDPNYHQIFVVNGTEIYYKYESRSNDTYRVSRMVLPPDGNFELLNWVDSTLGWDLHWTSITGKCGSYGFCGAYGSCGTCDVNNCDCLFGFEPKYDPSHGCRRQIGLRCGSKVRFAGLGVAKLPDTRHSWFNESMTYSECETECQNNCSCTAYGSPYDSKIGCLLWFDDLIDIKQDPGNYAIHIKMADYHELPAWMKLLAATVSPIVGVVLISMPLTLYTLKKMKKKNKKKISQLKREGLTQQAFNKDYSNESREEELELPLFSLSEITKATNDFSINNKLGEGGFGPVFKGMLEEGRKVAVKRLSRTSRQGLDEFKNEVICIAKLQHRNLVKLLGCCIEGDELMLIYEYLPNKSLDSFIFDETKNSLLDWPQRFHIIHGISRGILYLHQDSQLRIIHRDLKASNILLDRDMNPKISDFGLARMFRGYETEANTNKVVGTLGYISPEYAVNGLFSTKSDIFSFGVLVLEIVSGKKNREFSNEDCHDNLQGYAWRLYKEGKSLELVDASADNSWIVSEVLRSIHVGLLCVQQRAEDRPSMSTVVLMLGGEGALPPPKQPGFFTQGTVSEVGSATIKPPAPTSVNEITITLLDAR